MHHMHLHADSYFRNESEAICVCMPGLPSALHAVVLKAAFQCPLITGGKHKTCPIPGQMLPPLRASGSPWALTGLQDGEFALFPTSVLTAFTLHPTVPTGRSAANPLALQAPRPHFQPRLGLCVHSPVPQEAVRPSLCSLIDFSAFLPLTCRYYQLGANILHCFEWRSPSGSV